VKHVEGGGNRMEMGGEQDKGTRNAGGALPTLSAGSRELRHEEREREKC